MENKDTDFEIEEVSLNGEFADNSYVQLGCWGDGNEGDSNLC